MGSDADPRTTRRRALRAAAGVGLGFLAGAAFGVVSGWQKGGPAVAALVGAAMALAGAFVAAAAVGFGAAGTGLLLLLRPRGDAAEGDYDDRPPTP
jgi:hypothetical protein